MPSPLAISATDKPVKGRWVGKPRFRPQGEDDFLEPNEYIVYRCVRENRPAIEQPKWQDFAARYCHKLNGKCRKPKCSECLADLAERLEWRMEKYTRVQPEKMLGWVVEEAGG